MKLEHPARPFQAKNYLTRINASEFCAQWSPPAVTKSVACGISRLAAMQHRRNVPRRGKLVRFRHSPAKKLMQKVHRLTDN
jgi:hypothetical protein